MARSRSDQALMVKRMCDLPLGKSLNGQGFNLLMVRATAFPQEALRISRADHVSLQFRAIKSPLFASSQWLGELRR
jgi:hypothetical protein